MILKLRFKSSQKIPQNVLKSIRNLDKNTWYFELWHYSRSSDDKNKSKYILKLCVLWLLKIIYENSGRINLNLNRTQYATEHHSRLQLATFHW